MKPLAHLNAELDARHILKHPLYQAWSHGQLTLTDLQVYACQYYHHVDAFPRYISATHSNCQDIKARQVLLANLIDEEQGDGNHPELWLRFAEGVGEKRENVLNAHLLPETRRFIDTFMNYSKSSYAEGLGALYAYERQVPQVAATKIEGLEKFYGIHSEDALIFFKVHLEADVEHASATEQLLLKLSEEDKARAFTAALGTADALWNLLTGIQRETIGMQVCEQSIH